MATLPLFPPSIPNRLWNNLARRLGSNDAASLTPNEEMIITLDRLRIRAERDYDEAVVREATHRAMQATLDTEEARLLGIEIMVKTTATTTTTTPERPPHRATLEDTP